MRNKKTLYQSRFRKVLTVLVILLVCGVGLFGYKYFFTKKDFQKALESSSWVEYQDGKLGYSFYIPDSWPVTKTDNTTDEFPISEFGAPYDVSVNPFGGPYFVVSFHKQPVLSDVENILNPSGESGGKEIETQKINGNEYTQVVYSKDVTAYNRLIRLISKDRDLLVQIRISYPEDVIPLKEDTENQLISKILQSIKKI